MIEVSAMAKNYIEGDQIQITAAGLCVINMVHEGETYSNLTPKRLFPLNNKDKYITLLDEEQKRSFVIENINIGHAASVHNLCNINKYGAVVVVYPTAHCQQTGDHNRRKCQPPCPAHLFCEREPDRLSERTDCRLKKFPFLDGDFPRLSVPLRNGYFKTAELFSCRHPGENYVGSKGVGDQCRA